MAIYTGTHISPTQIFMRSLVHTAQRLSSPGSEKVFSLPNNIRYACPISSDIARQLTLGVEPLQHAVARQMLKPGDTFIDIGANRGLLTMVGARAVSAEGRVFAFEPSDREVTALEGNLNANRIFNVGIFRKAVTDQSGRGRLALAEDGQRNSLAETRHPGQKISNWFPIELTTLDRFVGRVGSNGVRLINIDVEGSELLVLRGGERMLSAANAPTLLIKLNDMCAAGFRTTGARVFDHLGALGYRVFELGVDPMHQHRLLLEKVERRVSYPDNLIVATKDVTSVNIFA